MNEKSIPATNLGPIRVLQDLDPALYREIEQKFKLSDRVGGHKSGFGFSDLLAMSTWLYERTGDRSLGFKVGINSPANTTGPIGVFLSGCGTLREALQYLSRYYPLVSPDGVPLRIQPNDEGICAALSGFAWESIVDVYIRDLQLGRLLKHTQRISGSSVRALYVAYPESEFGLPEGIDNYTRAVRPSAGSIEVQFANGDLDKAAPYANPDLCALLKPRLDEELGNLQASDTLTQQILRHLDALESLKGVNQSQVASRFHMSESSLKRRLSDEGDSFTDLFQRYRRNRALAMLTDADNKLEVVAELLGFSERASFERAFRQWFDMTPAAYRKQVRHLSGSERGAAGFDIDKLPASPKVCNEILKLTSSDDFDIDELVRIVGLDPLLSAKVLSIARSAFYGARNVKDLESAICAVLGVDQVRYLALMMASNSSFADRLPENFDLRAYWRKSLVTADLVTSIGRGAGEDRVQLAASELYLTGLFHDIGRFMLANLMSGSMQAYLEACSERDVADDPDLARQHFGLTTAEAGALLLAHWGLPRSVFRTVRELETAGHDDEARPAARLIACAADFAARYFPSTDEPQVRNDFVTAAAEISGLDASRIDTIVDRQVQKTAELDQLIGELIS